MHLCQDRQGENLRSAHDRQGHIHAARQVCGQEVHGVLPLCAEGRMGRLEPLGAQEAQEDPRGRRIVSSSLRDARSAELYGRAVTRLAGGVNSPVRAMRAIGRDPVFIDRGEGAELVDVDGNRYVDYVCSWGPLIAGHANPEILEAVEEAASRGTSFGAPTAAEVELAEEISRRMTSVEMLRMTSSGTGAV